MVMVKAAVVLWFLNIFDALATYYAVVVRGYAKEANPAMAWLIHKGPIYFLLVKVFGMAAMLYLLIKVRKYGSKLSKYSLAFLLGLYVLISLLHVYGFLFFKRR
jgi:hypothetical protein